MTRRLLAVAAIGSALTFFTVPALAYWSGPVAVDLTVQTDQALPPATPAVQRQASEALSEVTVTWPVVGESTGPRHYLLERTETTVDGVEASTSWQPLESTVTCSGTTCSAVDQQAPAAAAYRVSTRLGTAWTSAPSAVARTWVLKGEAAEPDEPTASATTEPDATGRPEGADPSGPPPSDLAPSDGGCADGTTAWTFTVPPARLLADGTRFRIGTTADRPQRVQLAGAGGWTVAGELAAGDLLDLEPEPGQPLLLRLCAVDPAAPGDPAAPASAPFLVIDG